MTGEACNATPIILIYPLLATTTGTLTPFWSILLGSVFSIVLLVPPTSLNSFKISLHEVLLSSWSPRVPKQSALSPTKHKGKRSSDQRCNILRLHRRLDTALASPRTQTHFHSWGHHTFLFFHVHTKHQEHVQHQHKPFFGRDFVERGRERHTHTH